MKIKEQERLKYIDEFDIRRICDNEPMRAVAIMTLIAEELGSVSKSTFAQVSGLNKRTVERHCKNGKIICDGYLGMPLVNIYLRQLRGEIS